MEAPPGRRAATRRAPSPRGSTRQLSRGASARRYEHGADRRLATGSPRSRTGSRGGAAVTPSRIARRTSSSRCSQPCARRWRRSAGSAAASRRSSSTTASPRWTAHARSSSQRIDALAETVESATTSLGSKEQELAALHRHFTESSTRIESIVERHPRGAARVSGAELDLARRACGARRADREGDARGDGCEGARARRARAPRRPHRAARRDRRRRGRPREDALARRAEVARGAAGRCQCMRAEPGGETQRGRMPTPDDEPSEDLLAGLRDSLQAMESVAAEMARASETLSGPVDEPPTSTAEAPEHEEALDGRDGRARARHPPSAGATIVPLRAGEP